MKRMNKFCKYYPCHAQIEDCTFCWCPFYPCLNKALGYFVRTKNKNGKVWACDRCEWIHRRDVVDRFFKLIRDDFKIELR